MQKNGKVFWSHRILLQQRLFLVKLNLSLTLFPLLKRGVMSKQYGHSKIDTMQNELLKLLIQSENNGLFRVVSRQTRCSSMDL